MKKKFSLNYSILYRKGEYREMKTITKDVGWFTPKEVIDKVYGNKISMGLLVSQCNNGQIPCERMGTGKRRLILIPAFFVREQLEKAFGKNNPIIEKIMYREN